MYGILQLYIHIYADMIYPCLGYTILSPEMPESVSAKAVCGGVDTRRVLTGRAIDSVATSQDVSGPWIWVI